MFPFEAFQFLWKDRYKVNETNKLVRGGKIDKGNRHQCVDKGTKEYYKAMSTVSSSAIK